MEHVVKCIKIRKGLLTAQVDENTIQLFQAIESYSMPRVIEAIGKGAGVTPEIMMDAGL